MNKICIAALLLAGCLVASAQEIKVKSMVLTNESNAQVNPKFNANGDACALIRIVVPMVKDIQFSDTYLLPESQKYKPGEYTVWVFPGAKKLKFRHENFPSGQIVFADYLKDEQGNPMSIEGKKVYRIELDVPTIATTYEELIDIARDYQKNYTSHTESSYFLAAVTAYDQAIGHNDCPPTEREKIYEERNQLAAIRKMTYFRERTDTLARKAEEEKGFTSDDTYKYLSGEYNIINKLVDQYPEITGFVPIREAIHQRLVKHPKSQVTVTDTVTVHRQQIAGTVRFKSEYITTPLNTLRVYASPTSRIDPSQSRLIGRVNANGTFTVVVPDDMKYIFVDGEKKEAHYISPDMTDISIIIK